MVLHLTHPDAVTLAVERDIRDKQRLQYIHSLVTKLLDDLIPQAADLAHPDVRWQPDDLIEVLTDQAKSIAWELNRVSLGPVVVE